MTDINTTSANDSQTRSATATTSPPGGNGHKENGIVSRVRERAAAELATQKNLAFDGIGSVAQAVRQSTQQLREQQHETLAEYVEQAADQIEHFVRQLRGKDLNELFDDAQRLARRQPAVFIGSVFALGLIGARFFKSSPRPGREHHLGGGYRPDTPYIAGHTGAPASGSVGGTGNMASSSSSRSAGLARGSSTESLHPRETAHDESIVPPARTTTGSTGERSGMGSSVSPSPSGIGDASQSAARSGRVSASTERTK